MTKLETEEYNNAQEPVASSVEAGESLDQYFDDSPAGHTSGVPDGETEESQNNSDTEEEATSEDDAEESESSTHEETLIAGKFKSHEELEKAYRELERRHDQQKSEIGNLRKLASENGNESEVMFGNIDVLNWKQHDDSEDLYARRGKWQYVKSPDGGVYVLGDDGLFKDRHGVPYYTEQQWDQLAEELESEYTDEEGNVDARSLAREVSRIRAEKERERLQALASRSRDDLATANKKNTETKPDNDSIQAFEEEKSLVKKAILEEEFSWVPGAEEYFATYFKEADDRLAEVPEEIRYQPGAYEATMSLLIAANRKKFASDLRELIQKEGVVNTPAPKTKPKRLVITENGSTPTVSTSQKNTAQEVTLPEY